MKIKKMIESLEKFSKLNPDANVKLHGKCGESALFILGTKNDNETIWIESESDVNMKEEISERFKYIDECDNAIGYYADMLDLGITPTMVGKYIGKEYEMRMLIDCASYNLLNREECINYINTDLIWVIGG